MLEIHQTTSPVTLPFILSFPVYILKPLIPVVWHFGCWTVEAPCQSNVPGRLCKPPRCNRGAQAKWDAVEHYTHAYSACIYIYIHVQYILQNSIYAIINYAIYIYIYYNIVCLKIVGPISIGFLPMPRHPLISAKTVNPLLR